MKLRNKETGEIIELLAKPSFVKRNTNYLQSEVNTFNSLAELNNKWEDYDEPKKYKYVLPNKVRRAILSWVRVQDNPIEEISILLKTYYDTGEVDSDGFYNYEFFGYVGDNNKNLVANTLNIRLKRPFYYEKHKDYTLLELGILDDSGGGE